MASLPEALQRSEEEQMKASQVITQLQELIVRHGDRECIIEIPVGFVEDTENVSVKDVVNGLDGFEFSEIASGQVMAVPGELDYTKQYRFLGYNQRDKHAAATPILKVGDIVDIFPHPNQTSPRQRKYAACVAGTRKICGQLETVFASELEPLNPDSKPC